MKQILWETGLALPHDPNASEIYQWDLVDWLDGETLVNPPTVTAETGITAVVYFVGASSVDVRVSGGTAGNTYSVTVRATSAAHSRIQDFTVNFVVSEQ
jgi:hypothetical protein